jgi:hypothetical protein
LLQSSLTSSLLCWLSFPRPTKERPCDLLGPWAFREVFYLFSGPRGYLSPTVGIYLYLVNANKILTNFKSNARLQPSSLVSLTLHVSSHLWRVHAYYSPQLVELWTYVSSLLLSHTPTGQEQVPRDEALGGCCEMFVRGLGHRLPVNFGLLDRCQLIM